MRAIRLGIAVLLGSALIAVCFSCSYIHKITGGETKAVDAVVKQAQASLALGDYEKALAVYSDASEKYPDNQELRMNYVRTCEQARGAADNALQKKEFSEAGGIYGILLKSGVTGTSFSGLLTFDADYLNRQVKTCSKALLETGLMRYRDGNLAGAISIWKKALAFDHDNKDIKSAIDTATVQIQNLKNIK